MAIDTTDRIEKKVLLSAPRARVWKALMNATEFGQWFGVRFDGPFSPGTAVRDVMVPTTADAEVAKAQEPYRQRLDVFSAALCRHVGLRVRVGEQSDCVGSRIHAVMAGSTEPL